MSQLSSEMRKLVAHIKLQHRLLMAFGDVVAAVLEADRALIPDDVWDKAVTAKALIDEHVVSEDA